MSRRGLVSTLCFVAILVLQGQLLIVLHTTFAASVTATQMQNHFLSAAYPGIGLTILAALLLLLQIRHKPADTTDPAGS